MTNIKEYISRAFLIREVRTLEAEVRILNLPRPIQIQTWNDWLLSSERILFEEKKLILKKGIENNLLKYQSWQKLRIVGVAIVGLAPVALRLLMR